MKDQADKLRQIINDLEKRTITSKEANKQDSLKSTKVITVTSGKGGVGKTSITVNMAVTLSELGYKVVIIDADFGLANIDVLFGIVPRYTLVDLINNNKTILEILCDGPNNIKFISGGAGVEELAKLDNMKLQKFIENIALIDSIADVIIIDTGAGISDNVISMVMAADEIVLVTTPEPTAVTDAYAMIKMISNRDKTKEIKVIINKAESYDEAQKITTNLTEACKRFLTVKLTSLGYILNDSLVTRAIKTQQPFSIKYPKSVPTKFIKQITQNIMKQEETKKKTFGSGIKGFFNNFFKYANPE